jgi:aspartate kinase
LIVMKFGGSSVADAERIVAAGRIVQGRMGRGPVVIVSALAGVTDLLVDAVGAARRGERDTLDRLLAELERRHRWALTGAVEDAGRRHRLSLEIDRLFEDLRQRLRSIRILGEATPRAADAVLASGEDLSARIVVAALRDLGVPARWVDPREVLLTDRSFGEAEPRSDAVRERARALLSPIAESGEVPLLGGFVGASADGDTTTLGRGGSDTSAAVLGSALEAEEIEIWTDVDGLMSADPRLVPAARTLPRVSFAEAAELAFYGARVLHPDSIAPAVQRRIPVRVLNSLRPDGEGSLIVEDGAGGELPPLASVASRSGVCLVRLTSRRMRADASLLAAVTRTLDEAGLSADLVVATEVAVSMVLPRPVDPALLERALGSLARIEVEPERAIVCVVGTGLARGGPFRAAVLAALADLDPETVVLGASPASLAAVLPQARLEQAVRELHRRFFEEGRES